MSPSIGVGVFSESERRDVWWVGYVRKVSPSGVGHPYNMCRHLLVLEYLVRVRGEKSGGLDR